MANEPCISCGEDTAIGTIFYSDRLMLDDGAGRSVPLCTLCDSRIRTSQRGPAMTAEQILQLVKNGSMGGVAWSGRG
jgi:hypothetical protein